jgi:hypothetical protein
VVVLPNPNMEFAMSRRLRYSVDGVLPREIHSPHLEYAGTELARTEQGKDDATKGEDSRRDGRNLGTLAGLDLHRRHPSQCMGGHEFLRRDQHPEGNSNISVRANQPAIPYHDNGSL